MDLRAITTGSDGDFVVKLIDVYPADYPNNPKMRGYQLPIAMDILRGRYRTSFEHPSAIPANKPQQYRFELPNVNHVFQPGHRIMVQIQSTLFPIYDRNPQTFVPNIFNAKAGRLSEGADQHFALESAAQRGAAAAGELAAAGGTDLDPSLSPLPRLISRIRAISYRNHKAAGKLPHQATLISDIRSSGSASG